MKQQFIVITIHTSKQPSSCFTLTNNIDMLIDPDWRNDLLNCQSIEEMVKIFPIVGQGMQIKKKEAKGQYQFKVVSLSQIERIIDTSGLEHITKDKANCILPLFQKEGNEALLNCELFKRKLSQLLVGNCRDYLDDAYLIMMEITVKYIFKVFDQSRWQNEILSEIFSTCEQVFINTPSYFTSIDKVEFKQSKYQLLNLFCLFKQNSGSSDAVIKYFIPLMSKNKQLDEESEQLYNFFQTLQIDSAEIIFNQNIKNYIDNYLKGKFYFCLDLCISKAQRGILQYFVPEDILKKSEEMNTFVNNILDQKPDCKRQTPKQLITCFFTARVHQTLLKFLIDKFNESLRDKLFNSITDNIEKESYYLKFLQCHPQYENLINYYQLWKNKGQEQLIIGQLVGFYKNEIKLSSLKESNPTTEQELVAFLQQFKQFKDTSEKALNILKILNYDQTGSNFIEEIQKNVQLILWINYQASKTNLNDLQQIKVFLELLISKINSCEHKLCYQNIYEKNFGDIPRFCYQLYFKSRELKKRELIRLENSGNILDEIYPRDRMKKEYCEKIMQLCKTLN